MKKSWVLPIVILISTAFLCVFTILMVRKSNRINNTGSVSFSSDTADTGTGELPIESDSDSDSSSETEKEPDSSSSAEPDSSSESSSTSSTEKDPEEPAKTLYVDDVGNTYELIKRVSAKDGRILVIFQNIETGTVSMAVESYFNEHYHPVTR